MVKGSKPFSAVLLTGSRPWVPKNKTQHFDKNNSRISPVLSIVPASSSTLTPHRNRIVFQLFFFLSLPLLVRWCQKTVYIAVLSAGIRFPAELGKLFVQWPVNAFGPVNVCGLSKFKYVKHFQDKSFLGSFLGIEMCFPSLKSTFPRFYGNTLNIKKK